MRARGNPAILGWWCDGQRTSIVTVNTITATGPLDDGGRLVHADDPAAQLALALARVEAAVAARRPDLP